MSTKASCIFIICHKLLAASHIDYYIENYIKLDYKAGNNAKMNTKLLF